MLENKQQNNHSKKCRTNIIGLSEAVKTDLRVIKFALEDLMKTYINKITRKGYSNVAIAKKLGVTAGLIHRHRKSFNPLIDKAIFTHFFTKKILIPTGKIKELGNVLPETFLQKVMRYIRGLFAPIWKGYMKLAYKG